MKLRERIEYAILDGIVLTGASFDAVADFINPEMRDGWFTPDSRSVSIITHPRQHRAKIRVDSKTGDNLYNHREISYRLGRDGRPLLDTAKGTDHEEVGTRYDYKGTPLTPEEMISTLRDIGIIGQEEIV